MRRRGTAANAIGPSPVQVRGLYNFDRWDDECSRAQMTRRRDRSTPSTRRTRRRPWFFELPVTHGRQQRRATAFPAHPLTRKDSVDPANRCSHRACACRIPISRFAWSSPSADECFRGRDCIEFEFASTVSIVPALHSLPSVESLGWRSPPFGGDSGGRVGRSRWFCSGRPSSRCSGVDSNGGGAPSRST